MRLSSELQCDRARVLHVRQMPLQSIVRAVTSVLNFSCGIVAQQRMLALGNRANFAGVTLHTPHFELRGKTIGLIGGNGGIGQMVATLCRALGMEVIIWSRSSTTITLDDLLPDAPPRLPVRA